MKIFAERLKLARTERGISQRELCRRLGVSQNLVGEYERAEAIPKIDSLLAIAQELDCTTDFLVGLED
ncbi:helix-turn-helix domain-containing protein [Ralstonia chuxiongensis]|uniref:Helix-turn-helix domain-containing protein n=1 Tax=Ralstonia chuxiongensis TaxID=2957504 RepID=A0AA41WRA7_9RALS|nr:helix-turn-helix transcriptional regulator [Ralstonia chuxiongensis]MCP1173778.1 helix-turn-helix domain-containing protein [Ralstonia chuxiongensis]